jgi:hypothetical protein
MVGVIKDIGLISAVTMVEVFAFQGFHYDVVWLAKAPSL